MSHMLLVYTALLIGDALALHCSSQDTDSTHVLVLHTCAEIFQPTHYSSTRESKSGTTTPSMYCVWYWCGVMYGTSV